MGVLDWPSLELFTFITGIRRVQHHMMQVQCIIVVMFLHFLSQCVTSLYLLDPCTGRTLKQGHRTLPSLVWGHGVMKQNPVAATQSIAEERISDYVSQAGTPLYKLRQRNPYGG